MTGQLKLNVEPFLAVLGIKIPQTSSLQRSYCFAVISQSVDLNKKGYDLDRIPVSYTHLDVYKRQVQAGGEVDSYTDKRTGLPVYSLYGKTREFTDEMLKGLDLIVLDIQDIGTRYYTCLLYTSYKTIHISHKKFY